MISSQRGRRPVTIFTISPWKMLSKLIQIGNPSLNSQVPCTTNCPTNAKLFITVKLIYVIYYRVKGYLLFNALSKNISVVSRQQVHLSMLSLSSTSPLFLAIFFPDHWQLSDITIIETMVSSERGMNPVAMNIRVATNQRK